MGIPERASSADAKYPEFHRVTIRPRVPVPPRARLRSLAWLACLVLAACESTAPTPAVEQAEPEPPAATAVEEPLPGPVDFAELFAGQSCEPETNRLCAVEALASIARGPSFRQLPAAPASGRTATTGSQSARPNRQSVNDRLWRLTGQFPPAEVAYLAQRHELASLWRLRQAMSGSRSARERAGRLRAWMNSEAGHPFVRVPPRNLARVLKPTPQTGRVGLFVPLSGVLATAGRAVRDGFIAAYLDDTAPLKPPLRIYDTAAGSLGAVYERSQADGVDLIVGPLSKPKLEALENLDPQVAVLGLNYTEAASGGGTAGNRPPGADTPANPRPGRPILQLGLAIEDEAATIVENLLARNHERLLAIRGTDDWAVRGARALERTWPHDIELQEFTDVRTVTESVGAAMGVAASEQRKEGLERLLNRKLEFLPRARTDLDGVVAFVDHLEATALAPALKYHLAGRLPPVYASSQSVRNASALAELSGFQVTELPFNLYADPLWNSVKAAFGDGGGNIAALRALGMDAYRIVGQWDWVASGEPLYGATGKLMLDTGGQVRRRLAWASIDAGKVRPMPPGATP